MTVDGSDLTLKMTAAEAVETSVTTTNSLSQDFTNLDDIDQPSQTLTDTPGFKPFTLLRSLGQSEELAKNYIRYASNVRCMRQQLWFNHRCKDLGLVPVGLTIKRSVLRRQSRDTNRNIKRSVYCQYE